MTNRTITIDVTEHRSATPDLATVESKAVGGGASASEARATARDHAATITESVTAVAREQVQTVECRVEEANDVFEPMVDAAYQATERLHIGCVPETAGQVVTEVTDAGGMVESVRFELHDSTRQSLRDEALAAAMERAREQADRLAAVEDLVVDDVQCVTTTDGVGTESYGMESIVDEALDGFDTDVAPTPISVAGAVEVVYELAEE